MYGIGQIVGWKSETGMRRVTIRAHAHRLVGNGVVALHYRVDDGDSANADLDTNGFCITAWVTEDELVPDYVGEDTTKPSGKPQNARKKHGPKTLNGWLQWTKRRATAKDDVLTEAYMMLFLARGNGHPVHLTGAQVAALVRDNSALSEACTNIIWEYVNEAIEAGELHEDVEIPLL